MQAAAGACGLQSALQTVAVAARNRREGLSGRLGHDKRADDTESDPEEMQAGEYVHSLRECWGRYDAARDQAKDELERGASHDMQAREDLRRELYEIEREQLADRHYHDQRMGGASPSACRELSPRIFDELQRDLEDVELHSSEDGNNESPIPWTEEWADWLEAQDVDAREYADHFDLEPAEEEAHSAADFEAAEEGPF